MSCHIPVSGLRGYCRVNGKDQALAACVRWEVGVLESWGLFPFLCVKELFSKELECHQLSSQNGSSIQVKVKGRSLENVKL